MKFIFATSLNRLHYSLCIQTKKSYSTSDGTWRPFNKPMKMRPCYIFRAPGTISSACAASVNHFVRPYFTITT